MKRISALFAAAVAFAGAASAQMQGYGMGQYGQQQQPYGGQGGYTQARASSLQALSGNWHYSWSGGADKDPMRAQIDATGRFMIANQVTRIQGQFNGMTGQGMAVSAGQNGRPMQNAVILQYEGQCHVQVTMLDSRGRPSSQGMFHVEHRPGQPCPAGPR